MSVRAKGWIAIVVGIAMTILFTYLMEELGGMLVVLLVIGPVAVVIGLYQVVTGRMLGKGAGDETGSVQAFVAGGGSKKGMSMEQARELQTRLLSTVTTEADVSRKINAAAQLMTAGLYQAAAEAYAAIAQRHPEKLATCESQIGAAQFFLGQYQEAIRYYELARQHGADAGMMDDNIREAREALAAGRAAGT